MKFGINTFLFTSPFTTESISLFPQFKKWGFDSVEIALEDASHIDAKVVKKALDDNGLVCGSICAAMGADRDFRGSASDQEGAKKYLEGIIDVMPDLGCPFLIGPLYSAVGRADFETPEDYKKQWDIVVKHLKSLADYAQKADVTLCLEPLNRFETDFLNTCDQGLKLVNDINHLAVGLHLDTFHMNIEEKNQAKAILKAGSKLKHFHACGTDRGTPGNDSLNWTEIFNALKQIGYDNNVVIESFTPDVKIIAKAASIWRNMEPSQQSIAEEGVKFLKKTYASA
ncbi:xylose isomerase [Terrimonas sp.]|uniref:sugar phosphate isomerase/epimerase family protein n=1 Tax=Terrimonas sp. TaxID=1914338 RepID=UPI000D50F6F8|nr:sugar phosphate isomerase/epimerase [Terrimonas sp.]PVD53387.1 xylose isomerase [Terrimonas sp.]